MVVELNERELELLAYALESRKGAEERRAKTLANELETFPNTKSEKADKERRISAVMSKVMEHEALLRKLGR